MLQNDLAFAKRAESWAPLHSQNLFGADPGTLCSLHSPGNSEANRVFKLGRKGTLRLKDKATGLGDPGAAADQWEEYRSVCGILGLDPGLATL